MTARLLAIAAALLIAGSAHAQINPYKGNRAVPRLDGSDLTAMEAAGQKLLVPGTPAKGAHQSWKNDATGSFGEVTYLGRTSRKVEGTTYPCRNLRYQTTTKADPMARSTEVTWCRLPDGTWKIGD